MARQPALNEDALVKLGAGKLAKLILEEAARNPVFRKLVTAALAATKGPAAIAAIIDKRLAGLERAKGFIEWDKAKAFAADLAGTVSIITGDLAEADPDAAIDRVIRFLATAGQVFERIDDSNGRLQDVYYDAAQAVPRLTGKLGKAERATLHDRLFAVTVADNYGFFGPVLPDILKQLPEEAIVQWDKRLTETEQSFGSSKTFEKDWDKRAKFNRVIHLRQAIADSRKDADAFIALEGRLAGGSPNTLAIAERLFGLGRFEEALEWVHKQGRRGPRVIRFDDMANLADLRQESDLIRNHLEIQILEAMGNRPAAQELRWHTFEETLDAGMLREHIARLPDFDEFDVLDKAFAHVSKFNEKYSALIFFLNWPNLDLAAKLVTDHRAEWEGRYYGILAPAAEALESKHGLAAIILYRALIDDILERGRSPAYGHAARYLERLDGLATPGSEGGLIEPHATYRAQIAKQHGRKSGFWSLLKSNK